jgi:hypothetical protein
MESELRASGAQSSAKKFQRYADKFRTEPFLHLLANKTLVTERDAMRAYGFTSATKSWSPKLSLIATKARRELAEHGIILPRAANRKGWSLLPEDRRNLRTLLDGKQLK